MVNADKTLAARPTRKGFPIPRVAVALSRPDYCTCCERTLSDTAVMLELDQRTYTYTDEENVPAEKSQGWFPFGMRCAKKKLAEHMRGSKR